jgi:protein involved in polysaccharide export with SLBB domain
LDCFGGLCHLIARRVKDDVSGKLAEIFHIDIDRNLKITGDNADMVLTPFDHVIVRRSPGFQRERLVRVEGEVFFPGEYTIAHANERISDLLKRSGGLNQFAYPKGATLIRRNEFYSSPSDNQIKSTNLTEVKQNLQRIKRDTTEAEKILLSRIDQKITERGGDLSNKQGGLLIDDFRRETIESLVTEEGEEVVKVKTQEMIGINLSAIMENPGGSNDLIIQEGDVLSIPKAIADGKDEGRGFVSDHIQVSRKCRIQKLYFKGRWIYGPIPKKTVLCGICQWRCEENSKFCFSKFILQ